MKKIKQNIVVTVTVFSLFLSASFPSYAQTIHSVSKSTPIISKWLSKGIFLAVSQDSSYFNQPMTRAEFAASLCRIFKFSEVRHSLILLDVPSASWYHSYVQKILSKGIMDFDSSGTNYFFHPSSIITVREAANSLLRAYNLKSMDTFTFKGLNLNAKLTRENFILLINQITQELIAAPCTYTYNANGNLIINVPNVILKDITIKGNLYLTEGVGTGCITLDNVSVTGVVYVNGCGENSLFVKNKSSVNSMIIENKICTVRLSSPNKTYIKNLILRSPTILDGPLTVSDPESNKYAVFSSESHFNSDSKLNTAASSSSQTLSTPHAGYPIPSPSLPPASDSSIAPIVPSTPIITPDQPIIPPNSSNDPIPEPGTPPDENNPPPPELPVSTGSAITLTTPSNIYIDFADYPKITLGWDDVSFAETYDVTIINSQNSASLCTLQTTASSIKLDNLYTELISGNKYLVSITASSNHAAPASVSKSLVIPRFTLYEANNGTLCLNKEIDESNTLCIKHLNLGLYQSAGSNGEAVTPLLHKKLFDIDNFPYLIPIALENDVCYSLKILGTDDSQKTAPALSTYTASYFANLSYQEVLLATSPIGQTESNPITLTSSRHLNNLSAFVAAGHNTRQRYFKMENDIDCHNPLNGPLTETTNNFIPIGVGLIDFYAVERKVNNGIFNLPFEGNFDGGNHTLSNLRIYIENSIKTASEIETCVGLFGLTTGNIKNITLDDSCRITVKTPLNITGGIVGCGYYFNSVKSISNCYNYASVHASYNAAGIIGYVCTNKKSVSDITIANCHNYGEITSDRTAAGIANSLFLNKEDASHTSRALITDCYNYGSIRSQLQVGGIAAFSDGTDAVTTIQHCCNFGPVLASRESLSSFLVSCGGILGFGDNVVAISHCVNGGAVTSFGRITQPSGKSLQKVTLETAGIVSDLNAHNSTLSHNYNYGPIAGTLLKMSTGAISSGTAASGAITAKKLDFISIKDCYSLLGVPILSFNLPNTVSSIQTLPYPEFINALKQSFSILPPGIEASIPLILAAQEK